MAALTRMRPHFEHEIRMALGKRRMPRLNFRWDEAFEKSADVLQLLRQLERQ